MMKKNEIREKIFRAMPEPGQTYARTIKSAHILRDPSLETYRGYDTNNTSLRVFTRSFM
jgi:hypothetical protein